MGLTKAEINLRRLLGKCELMIKSKQRNDERFPTYIQSLEEMWKSLQTTTPSIADEAITEYYRRINNIKLSLGLITEDVYNSNLKERELAEGNKISPREELLGIRKREVNPQSNTGNLDELIDYHENMQQKIADEMLILTKNLKEQSELANKIIKKDTEVVSKSSQLTDVNFTKLKLESNKLTEHSKKAWKCWMWIMLVIVLVVFINMVLFMKIMKKKY
ncbi:hypothetical protein RN001_001005 [Aquatica leii]|uniref:Vesicle transport protein USE1 n=1 Tax=Aquatica leii TaxID=1421715 RepID=A0AAN7Q3K4_9COLE|nr:hypothetical protein RN001_001005 [Aquatica leii]